MFFLKSTVIGALDTLITESHLFIQQALTTLQMKGSLYAKKMTKNTYN